MELTLGGRRSLCYPQMAVSSRPVQNFGPAITWFWFLPISKSFSCRCRLYFCCLAGRRFSSSLIKEGFYRRLVAGKMSPVYEFCITFISVRGTITGRSAGSWIRKPPNGESSGVGPDEAHRLRYVCLWKRPPPPLSNWLKCTTVHMP